ncbi:hypothetical protein Cfor_10336 [Coptotermes formosanus]|uniref:Uncharacterized protein n=1 Tax=Coptotermes formosanus TaxID=36987 RepID=A0A6L2PSG4_COPFO|nr:hypothetical protein Cfor_10336 [Coptotermes formosanus]
MYVSGLQVPSGGVTLNASHEQTTTLAYQMLFSGSGIHHGNAGLQITHDLYINGCFLLLFDTSPDLGFSDGHTSLADSGNMGIELKFDACLKHSITCLLYLLFRLQTSGASGDAKLAYDKHSITLKINKFNCLLTNIGLLENQLARYAIAQLDVRSNVTAGNCANVFVEPTGTLAVVFCMLLFWMN